MWKVEVRVSASEKDLPVSMASSNFSYSETTSGSRKTSRRESGYPRGSTPMVFFKSSTRIVEIKNVRQNLFLSAI